MSNKEEFEKISKQSMDLLINATLKRHGINLDTKPQLSDKEREELKSLIEGLKQNVESLTNITKK
jgi:malate/lactate dehydrogenase